MSKSVSITFPFLAGLFIQKWVWSKYGNTAFLEIFNEHKLPETCAHCENELYIAIRSHL
jgi:hypothetical protein